jgi:glycosyltransferase involved in cell wall biosynthesis
MSIPSDIQTASVLVSVGVPVYNGGKFLARALDSLLAQTHRHLEIIISDNASTDDTADICSRYAQKDNRIVYHRQPANLGASANFETVLRLAQGEFFMWAAHDDWWAPPFVEQNLRVLVSQPDVVASISKVRLDPPDPAGERGSGTFPLRDTVQRNVLRYLAFPGMNSRMYALFRRSALVGCFKCNESCWGYDWLLIVRLLKYGQFAEVNEHLCYRNNNYTSINQLARSLRSIIPNPIARIFPLAQFTRLLLAESHVPKTPGLLLTLALHNLQHSYMSLKAIICEGFARKSN